MRALATALALAATPAAADPLGLIDYEALFAAHADRVRTDAQGNAVLALPPATRITRLQGDLEGVLGIDMSQGGAPGCIVSVALDIAALSGACPDLLSDAQRRAFDANLAPVLAFYAANVFPPTTPDAVRARLDALAADRAAAWRAAPEWSAAACLPDPENAPLVTAFTSDALGQMLPAILAVPRLPVGNPCL